MPCTMEIIQTCSHTNQDSILIGFQFALSVTWSLTRLPKFVVRLAHVKRNCLSHDFFSPFLCTSKVG